MPITSRPCRVKDAEWTADLVRHGLIKPSFVPPPPIRELRDLVRLRRSVSEALATEQNRTLKLLEHQVGQRGQRSVRRVRPGDAEGADREHRHAAGDGGPGEAEVAPQAGALALDGRLSEHHRYLLAFHLRRVEAIEADLRALDERIEEKPYQAQRRLLRQIPGVDDRIAVAIIAEIGIDMTVFGNAKRLAAWAGVCPGNHESAGKKKSTATLKGNIHLKTVQAAVCAARTKGSY